MKLLVVEDEHKIANSLKKGLEQESYVVDVAFDGDTGYDLASTEPYDVIVLDIMLPGRDGISICKELRKEGIHTPVLMLTAKGNIEDKVGGLNSGADDYLTKPFAFEELLARVRALTRRPREQLATSLEYHDLSLNTLTMDVRRGNVPIDLSRKEFMLLEFFMRHPNTIFNKDQLIERVWSIDSEILPNTVEVYVGYLRRKIDTAMKGKPQLIHTVRGFGYKLGDR